MCYFLFFIMPSIKTYICTSKYLGRTTLSVKTSSDLNRQVIKADSASIYIPKIEFEIPPNAQRGTISTIEGILIRAAEHLDSLQSTRLKLGDLDNFYRCQKVIRQLRKLAGHPQHDDDEGKDDDVGTLEGGVSNGSSFFDFIVDDPSGNSFIESINVPAQDEQILKEYYIRTPVQDMALGLQPTRKTESLHDDNNDEIPKENSRKRMMEEKKKDNSNIELDESMIRISDDESSSWDLKQEALTFQTKCASCLTADTETKMCMIQIPHFKDVIIMSMTCDKCGYKSNEIKGGGGIPKYGTRIILNVSTTEDLKREILKSDSAGISIPEVELEMEEGGLGGVYTTVEGLLKKIGERLNICNPFNVGDSAMKQHETNDGGAFSPPSSSTTRYMDFLTTLDQMRQGRKLPFTLCMDDPLSNSFIGPVPEVSILLSKKAEREDNNKCLDEYVDPGIQIEEYTRSKDQDEILGLIDMKTENYRRPVRGTESDEDIYRGTDSPNELPDRLMGSQRRCSDHPHETAKGSQKYDSTIMGKGSLSFARP